MTGEDFLIRQYYGFHQTAVRFEPGMFLEILPDTNVLAVGTGEKKITGGSEGIDVSLLSDKRTYEGFMQGAVMLLRPMRFRE